MGNKKCYLVLGDGPWCQHPALSSAPLLDVGWERWLPFSRSVGLGLRFQHLLSKELAVPSAQRAAVNQEHGAEPFLDRAWWQSLPGLSLGG